MQNSNQKLKFSKGFLASSLFIAILAAAFSLGFIIGQESKSPQIQGIVNQELGKPENLDFSLFWDAWSKLEEKFITRESFDRQKMIYGAISGMVKSLGDPYTIFMDPQETERFQEDILGKFEGIGAEIGIKKGVLTIIAPLKNTPAERAGLRSGDKILKIDETSTADLTLDQAVNLIRGPKGTTVTLSILRDDILETQEINIIRDVIEVPSLNLKFLDGPDSQKIAHISFYQFSEKSSSDFKETVKEVLKSGASKIILDLRNNPGGFLEVSQDIASWFLERGQVVAIEEFSDGARKEYKAKGNPLLLDFPLVILINQGSASASEIVAGALRDNRSIKLIGEKTFGKGSVQELSRLKSGSSLKITVARWLTPSGKSITEEGLEPDVKVEMTAEDFDEGKDPQLEKAIEILNTNP